MFGATLWLYVAHTYDRAEHLAECTCNSDQAEADAKAAKGSKTQAAKEAAVKVAEDKARMRKELEAEIRQQMVAAAPAAATTTEAAESQQNNRRRAPQTTPEPQNNETTTRTHR